MGPRRELRLLEVHLENPFDKAYLEQGRIETDQKLENLLECHSSKDD